VRSVLKRKISKLNKSDPWTTKEYKTITAYERNYIRILQLQHGINKNIAKERYVTFAQASKRTAEKMRRSTQKFIKSMYPKHRKVIGEEIPRHKKVKAARSRKEKEAEFIKREYKRRMKPFSVKYISFEQWLLTQKLHGRLKRPNIIRVIKAHQKYPDDTLYQLSHGHHVGGGK